MTAASSIGTYHPTSSQRQIKLATHKLATRRLRDISEIVSSLNSGPWRQDLISRDRNFLRRSSNPILDIQRSMYITDMIKCG